MLEFSEVTTQNLKLGWAGGLAIVVVWVIKSIVKKSIDLKHQQKGQKLIWAYRRDKGLCSVSRYHKDFTPYIELETVWYLLCISLPGLFALKDIVGPF